MDSKAAQAGKGGPAVLFARNQLCALVRPGLAVDTASLLDRLLDPGVKLGTSTPRAAPSGDNAWQVFRKAEAQKPGAFAVLENKALQLTGGPASPPAPAGRSLYGMLVAEGKADMFLTYCTGALAAQREHPGQQIVRLPYARGRRRLRPDSPVNGWTGGLPICHVHPGGRPTDPGEARVHGAEPQRSTPMKLSARNVLKGKISDVKKGATTAHIKIDIGGQMVTAAITNEAAEELKLAKGQDAYAVIKASDVMVAVD